MKRLSDCVQCLLLVFLQFCAMALNARNQENITFVVNGKPISIKLSDQPVITYLDNTLHIESRSNVTDIAVNNINFVFFANESPVSISQLPYFKIQNGDIFVNQQPPGSKVLLFTIYGIKLTEAIVDVDGKAVINIGRLAKGAYIIKSTFQTVKYVNK